MANPVSMFGPDGQIHDVQAQDMEAAMKSGGELAHEIKGPDGLVHYVRHSQLGVALRSGGIPVAALQTGAQPQQPKPGLAAGFQSGLGLPGSITDVPQGIKQFIQHPYDTTKMLLENAGEQQVAGEQAMKRGDSQSPVVQALKDKNYSNAVGQVAGGALGGMLLGRLGANSAYGKTVKAPIPDAEAAAKITNAVNPAPRQMAKFQDNVQKQMPNIRQFITEKPKSPSDLLDVVTKATETKRADYYQNIIQPHSGVNVPTPSLYKGELAGNGNATIAQLDKRLSQINSMLSGAYDKEGVSQIQALSAPEKMSLKAESAQIRDVMNQELGTRTGLGKDAVAQARADFGQLRDIQMKLQTAISKQRYYENLQKQKPISPADVTAAGLARQAVKIGERKVLGTPQERAIKSAF